MRKDRGKKAWNYETQQANQNHQRISLCICAFLYIYILNVLQRYPAEMNSLKMRINILYSRM